MPTTAERSRTLLSPSSITTSTEWTDDLPSCRLSGVGYSTNQVYKDDGTRRDEHEYDDDSFRFTVDCGLSVYGLLDGHGGKHVTRFASQRLPAELLLGQLEGKSTDQEIKDQLLQAFIATEKGYMESIGEVLAERADLRSELPEGANNFEVYKQSPELAHRLQELDDYISAGTTAVVCVIYRDKLYVASVGNSRALLVRVDENDCLNVEQLTSDHDTHNEDELLRLQLLGVNVTKFRQGSRLGAEDLTRCLGNYLIKGGYKECDVLCGAKEEPVTAVPEVYGGIKLESCHKFLLLYSGGLYRALEEATGTEQVNKEIASMVMEQFKTQNTLTGVAQGVVDKVGRIHHDIYMEGKVKGCQRRGDMTLLVRNFTQTPRHTESDTYTSSTESSEQPVQNNKLQLDVDGRTAPYVNFSPYWNAIKQKNT